MMHLKDNKRNLENRVTRRPVVVWKLLNAVIADTAVSQHEMSTTMYDTLHSGSDSDERLLSETLRLVASGVAVIQAVIQASTSAYTWLLVAGSRDSQTL